MIDTFCSRMGITRLKVGGGILSVLEAAAQADVKQSQNVFNALLSKDLDSTDDAGLNRIGRDEDIPRYLPQKSSGNVTITDTSFVKLSSKVYSGSYAPIVGSLSVLVESTTNWPASGEVYIGRNTSNLEGPIPYTSITDFGSYKRLNLSTATTKFHNRGESVVVSQGGVRGIGANTSVITQQGSLNTSVTFRTVYDNVIPDGETTLEGVGVVAVSVGESGNIPDGLISSFSGNPPFTGAAVTNPLPFINGRDIETTNDYKQRIREVRASRIRGTDASIKNAVIGATAPDESKRISSVSLARYSERPSVMYIDDGSGYEPIAQGVGIENIESSASGGEIFFQTTGRPIEQASIKSGNQSPFQIKEGAGLSVTVGGITTVHFFEENLSASAFDVISSINANSLLQWSARTADSGLSVRIFAKSEKNDDVKVNVLDSNDANDVLAFGTATKYTTLLYKNDRLLSKDGLVASYRSNKFASWNAMSGSQTIAISVDNTPTTTYTFVDQDFIDAATGFVTVGKNSLASWVTVINKKIPGITAVIEADYILLTSNAGRSGNAAIYISGGTLTSNDVFDVGSVSGQANDYALDRGVGQIELQKPLLSGETLSLGTIWTRGFLETASIPITTLVDPVQLWFAVDANPYNVPHGIGSGTQLTATVLRNTHDATHVVITATSTSESVKNVAQGDWLVLSDKSSNLPSSLRNSWRVIETLKDGSNLLNKVVIEKKQMQSARIAGAAAAMNPAGGLQSKILVTGGYTSTDVSPASIQYGTAITGECEIYDPNTGVWTTTGKMITPRAHHTLSILPDGKLIAIGGYTANNVVLSSTEIFDPNTNLWTAGPNLATGRAEHSANVLVSGRVLIAGGVTVFGTTATNNSVEYNQGTNTFINSATMIAARAAHGAVRLLTAGAHTDKVLVTGGKNSTLASDLATTERYDHTSFTWAAGANMDTARSYHGAVALSGNKALVVSGSQSQITNDGGATWVASVTVEANWLFNHKRQSLLRPTNNDVAIAYGGFYDGATKRIRHKKYDPNTLTWTTLADSYYNEANDRSSIMGVTITGAPPSPNANNLWFGGGLAKNRDVYTPVSTSEIWVNTSSIWKVADDALELLSEPLPNKGIAFIRTINDLHRALIPAAINYTAPTFQAIIESEVDGITASVYKTTKIRIETNSYDAGRDVSLVASTDTALFPLAIETQDSLTGHLGSVESGLGVGTPHDFQMFEVTGKAALPHTVDAEETYHLPYAPSLSFTLPPSTSIISGLRRPASGLVPDYWQSTWTAGNELRVKQYGNIKSKVVTVAAKETATDRFLVGIRDDLPQLLAPMSSIVFAHPFAISPRDNLTVLVNDNNDMGRFPINMWRRGKPTTAVYSSQIELSDYDAGIVPFAGTFGQTYDFDDFAVYMKARAKSHSADATRSVLWRYWRHGPEGNFASVRYMYPDAPEASVSVSSEQLQESPTTDIADGTAKAFANVILGSGEAKTGSTINVGSKIAVARCNETTGVWDIYVISGFEIVSINRPAAGSPTVLTLQVPNNGVVAQGPQSTGFLAGDVLWLEMNNPSITTLFSGSFAISAVNAFNGGTGQQEIAIPANTLHDGTAAYVVGPGSFGTVSYDTSGEVSFDGATAVDDLCRLESGIFPGAYSERTMRIAAKGKQYLRCRAFSTDASDVLPDWYAVTDPALISIFGGPTDTATAVVAAVNALHGDGLPSAVSGTVLGTGAGVINKATWDTLNNRVGRYDLTDGINYVQRTIDPVLITDDTEFLLKDAVSADLLTDSDWANEDVRLVPMTVKNMTNWLATPAVSGLFSFTEITDSDDGRRVQIASTFPGTEGSIEVQGGTANAATASVFGSSTFVYRGIIPTFYNTIKRGESDGLVGGRWCVINNTSPLTKLSFWSNVTTATVSSTGQWSFSAAPYSLMSSSDEVRIEIEKVGDFVAIRIPRNANTAAAIPNIAIGAKEGNFVYLTASVLNRSDLPQISTPNRGVYRIVRSSSNLAEVTLWVEFPGAVEEQSICKMKLLDASSTIPGDTWQVSTNVFSTENRGSWSVAEVGVTTPGGEQFSNNSFIVDISQKSPGIVSVATAFGSDASLVQLREGIPARFFKKVLCVIPSSDDPEYAHVQFDTAFGSTLSSAAAGSVITALDKLDFPAGKKAGSDGYRYNVGLVGEANRIIYGDQDGNAKSGYAANGARISVTGPLVKRIKIAVGIRPINGLPTKNIASQVKSAIASAVNKSPVGVNISISDIVAAARSVAGVGAVSVISPTYNSNSDTIKVGASEKPLVQDIEKDVLVTFVGE